MDVRITMISGVVYLLRIIKMFHGLMNNPVFIGTNFTVQYPLRIGWKNIVLPDVILVTTHSPSIGRILFVSTALDTLKSKFH